MQRLRVQITTISPVIMATSGGDENTITTSRYINGTALLGLFARRYLVRHQLGMSAHTDPTFRTWFLDGQLTFTNAYFSDPEQGKVYFPIPLSFQEPKYPPFGKIEDRLFQHARPQMTSINGDFVRIQDSTVERAKIKTTLNFHHSRNPETGTTQEGQIFTYESLDRGQTFEGNILGETTPLENILQEFGQETWEANLGRSKQTQYGKATVRIISPQPEPFSSEIEELRHSPLSDREGGLAMTLLSDLIVHNDYGLATTEMRFLENKLPAPIATDSILFIKIGVVENFVSIWGLPRPAEQCFKAGSCILLDASKVHQNALLEIQRKGIGERRHEGFGRIVFNWQQKRTKLTETCITSSKHQRPAGSCPELAKTTIHTSIRRLIEKHADLHALQQAEKFLSHHPPKKSLLGRLENLLKSSEPQEFRQLLTEPGKLRKKAKDQLKQCRSANETLLDFLTRFDVPLEEILDQDERAQLRHLLADISMEQIAQEQIDILSELRQSELQCEENPFEKRLYQRYFTTFFAMLRKRSESEGRAKS